MPIIVVAPDKFKGSLDAPAVCSAIARGLRRVWPDAEIRLCPMADGGDGTLDAVLSRGGIRATRGVTGAGGSACAAPYGRLGEADADGGPAPPVERLSQQRTCHDGHKERRREHDRQSLVKLQVTHRDEVQHGGREHQNRARDLHHGPARDGQPRMRDGIDQNESKHKRTNVAGRNDLRRGHLGGEIFCRRVEARETRDRPTHQGDAGDPLTAFVLGVFHGTGKESETEPTNLVSHSASRERP